MQVYFFEPILAVITAVPFCLAVTFPLEDTVAMDFLLLVQDIFLLVPVTFKVADCPFSKVSVFLFILTAADTVIG